MGLRQAYEINGLDEGDSEDGRQWDAHIISRFIRSYERVKYPIGTYTTEYRREGVLRHHTEEQQRRELLLRPCQTLIEKTDGPKRADLISGRELRTMGDGAQGSER